MVIRRVSLRLYLAAAAFVLGVLLTSLLLAGFVTARRINGVERRWTRLRTEWHRLQLRDSELLHRFSPETCVATRLALLDSTEDLSAVQRKLDRYLTSTFGEANGRFIELKHEQVRLALAHWSLLARFRKRCDSTLLPILYLYSEKSCAECFFQTEILRFMERRHRPKLVVFPVNVDFASPEHVNRLRELYAVSSLPAAVIGETKYEGFLSRDKLQMILASTVPR